MASNFLETGTVSHSFSGYSYDSVLNELKSDMEENNRKITHLRQMAETTSDKQNQVMLDDEYKECLSTRQTLTDGLELLKEYPEEFPVLYAMISREAPDQSGVKFELNEVLAHTEDIVTESQDVMPKGKQLELACELPDAGKFGIVVTPYDKAGEDSEQLKARINFEQKTIDNLNEARLKRILEFCEKKGLSVYDLTIPYKDGLIDVDEKLAELTKKFLEDRHQEDVMLNEQNLEEENNYHTLIPEIKEIEMPEFSGNSKNKKPKKKEVSLDSILKETVDLVEKDLKKTRGLSYFETTKNINGLRTYVFTLYDKPNKDNQKLDGLKDKNGNYIPTYSHKLYVSQNPKTGKFIFGYSMPGGKKMDDAIAGDFLGVIKKTGVTHVRFHDLSNADKGVWMMACAEKGLVPIGIALNTAKASAMVEAARKKLSTEEFIAFKYRLAEQMIENAKAKCSDKSDKNFGLSKSEMDFISGLKSARNFESFRIGYNDGLYGRVLEQIDKGSKDSEKGAAITFGSMRALKTVFDIYFGHQEETLAQRLQSFSDFTPDELAQLAPISSKKLEYLNIQDFVLLYDTVLQRHINNAENDILQAYARELKRTPRRADGIILSSDLFPRAKGAVNEINITLSRYGIETLTLPLEHKGLEFARPENLDEMLNSTRSNANNNSIVPPVNQNSR